MPVIEVKGLVELVAKLRELASGKYLDNVVRASRARSMKRLSQVSSPASVKRPTPAPGRWARPSAAETLNYVNVQHSPHFVISHRATYAPIVVGPRRQSVLQRRSGWTPVDEILAEEAPRVEADLVKAVENTLARG